MIRTSRAVLFLAALGATTALALGGAEAKSAAVGVPLKIAAATPAAPEIAPVASPVAAAPVAVVPACARRVKVIYSGYGEADRASCDASSATATR